MATAEQSLLLGTSGYDYPEWKGVFYPDDLKRKDFLSYYSTQFNALELNNTFYNMPTSERMLSFYERSEGRLSFSVKANRLLTHEVGPDWGFQAKIFRDAVGPLLEKSSLCSVLFQFPQSFHYTPENRIYLAKLIDEFKSFPVVVEFRHEEWIKESVLAGLNDRGASIALCDMPELKYLPKGIVPQVFEENLVSSRSERLPEALEGPPSPSSPLFYLRLHGRNADAWYADTNTPNGSARYDYNYTDQELSQFVPVIQNAVLTGKKPVVFFNNHPNGSGARNAKKLFELLNK